MVHTCSGPQHLRDSILVSEQHLLAEVLVFLHANEVVQRVKAWVRDVTPIVRIRHYRILICYHD